MTYRHAMSQTIDLCDDVGYLDYDLSRDRERFTAVLALRDGSRLDALMSMTVYVDGREAFLVPSMVVGEEFDVDVTGVLRLRLEFSRLT